MDKLFKNIFYLIAIAFSLLSIYFMYNDNLQVGFETMVLGLLAGIQASTIKTKAENGR